MEASVQCRSVLQLRSRFHGALVGAVAGDCLGAGFEDRDVVVLKDVLDMTVTVRPPRKFRYTDDTAMTRSVAASLIKQGRKAMYPRLFNAVDMAEKFVDEFNLHPHRGYGRHVGAVFDDLREEKYRDPFGPAKQQFEGRGSYGNGGAMRISPAALFMHAQPNSKVNDLVSRITRITHSNVDAINGAILQCAAVQTALSVEPDAERLSQLLRESSSTVAAAEFTTHFVNILMDRMSAVEREDSHSPEKHSPNKSRTQSSYRRKLKTICELLKSTDTEANLRVQVHEQLGTDISAMGSVPAAIYSFLHCILPVSDIPSEFSAFERTIIYAISLGGDTDTIASMAGAIAGAFYGETGLRPDWINCCEGGKEAEESADKLYALVHSSRPHCSIT